MKHIVLGLVLIALTSSIASARFVRSWSYEDLFKEADLVAIVKLESIAASDETLSGHGDSDNFQAKVAKLAVGKVLKGGSSIKTVDLLFFKYSDGPNVIANGAFFLSFTNPEKYHYIVFLKRNQKGHYTPITGDYDAALSVKKIVKDHFSPIESTKSDSKGRTGKK